MGCLHNKEIKQLLQLCQPSFPKLKYIDFFFSDFPAASEVHQKMPQVSIILLRKLKNLISKGIDDYSMTNSFKLIMGGSQTYCGSSLLQNKLCDIDHFSLPFKYCFICPHSLKAVPERQFNRIDWRSTISVLEKSNCMGVVVTQDVLKVPEHPLLKVLRNKTSIAEACEILKAACGFIGIDSFSATLAAQLELEIFIVKSINPRTYAWKKNIYFAPRQNFAHFLNTKIDLPRWML